MAEESRPAVTLRYVGVRFAGGRLPLDVLPDLPAFRDLLRSLAKERWRAANPERKRLPKGFGESLSFDLVAIDDGSAKPKLQLSTTAAHPMLPGVTAHGQELLEASYCELAAIIDDAANDRGPGSMSSDRAKILNRFGSGLMLDERIELVGTSGSDGGIVYLDTGRRKALITKACNTYDKRVDGAGRLAGVHESGRLRIVTDYYGEIDIIVDNDRVAEFDGNIGASVQFSLRVRLDRQDTFRAVEEVLAIDLVEGSDTLDRKRTRVEELQRLNAGWLNGDGESITEAAVLGAMTFLELRPHLANVFRIYPTPVGGILFEFKSNGWDLSVEFAATGSAELSGVQIDGRDEIEPISFPELGQGFLKLLDAYTGEAGE